MTSTREQEGSTELKAGQEPPRVPLSPGPDAAVGRAVGWEPGAQTRLCFAFNSGVFVPIETEITWGRSVPSVCPAAAQPRARRLLSSRAESSPGYPLGTGRLVLSHPAS